MLLDKTRGRRRGKSRPSGAAGFIAKLGGDGLLGNNRPSEQQVFLAHLQQGNVEVAVGEKVGARDTTGHCGNSGNSSEPRPHYHLQTEAVFHRAAGGEGLPAQFLNHTADGEKIAGGQACSGANYKTLVIPSPKTIFSAKARAILFSLIESVGGREHGTGASRFRRGSPRMWWRVEDAVGLSKKRQSH